MPWARLDEGYFTHRKVVDLSAYAKLLDLAAIAYSARELTDGALSASDVRIVAAEADVEGYQALADELVAAGRWERGPGKRYVIHDYLRYNPSREQVLKERDASYQRVTKWRADRRAARQAEAEHEHEQEHQPPPEITPETCNGVTTPPGNASCNAITNGVSNASPARASKPGTVSVTETVYRNPVPNSEPGDARATREGSDFYKNGQTQTKLRKPGVSTLPVEVGFNADLAFRIERIGNELGDDNIGASITRARRFQTDSHLDDGTMANAIKDAQHRLRKRLDDQNRSPPGSPMAYFLAILEQTTQQRTQAG